VNGIATAGNPILMPENFLHIKIAHETQGFCAKPLKSKSAGGMLKNARMANGHET